MSKRKFDWEYCECGCHGLEVSLGTYYRWALIHFPNAPQEHDTKSIELLDGHRYGDLMGTFSSMEEVENHMLQEIQGEKKKLEMALKTLKRIK